jgi:alpha-beta hydrolase superfamily lysophospholipase
MSAPAVRHINRSYGVLTAVGLIVVVALLAGVAAFTLRANEANRFQAGLAAFYAPPDPLPAGQPGELIRIEPLTPAPAGAQAWRILYHSQDLNGNDVPVSGMVFAPSLATPGGAAGPVVAWAHPTTGMADDCAPSRQTDPAQPLEWLNGMLAKGWVVTATDYASLGTPGTLPYLIGTSAGQDVLNSVRAAQQIQEANAGSTFATWGHSEGGHASLWASVLAPKYAPELRMVGAAAAAPAAELVALMSDQWQKLIAQVLGPYAVEGWSAWYPDLNPSQVLTPDAVRALPTLANACLEELGVEALARVGLQHALFAVDPTTVPTWMAVAQENSPGAPATSLPVFIANGTADNVVLPPTTTTLINEYCNAGVSVAADWMPGVGHPGAGNAAGDVATAWLTDRFAGNPPSGQCGPAQPPS